MEAMVRMIKSDWWNSTERKLSRTRHSRMACYTATKES